MAASQETVVFRARKIRTFASGTPEATHVAVREGRILGVGTLEELATHGPFRLEERLADKVLLPGFVEGHSHAAEGSVWAHTYVGYHPRRDPDGRLWPGLESIEAVVERLREAEGAMDDPERPLLAWGFDPIYFGGRRMVAEDLDRVSTRRPILVMHASFHVMNVNSPLMERAGITPELNVPGVVRDGSGRPNGELQESVAKFIAFRVAGRELYPGSESGEGLWRFARSALQVGVTTAADLFNELGEDTLRVFEQVTGDEGFPLRIVCALSALAQPAQEGVEKLERLRARSRDRLRLGIVKMMTDGSIQGFTGRLRWPGYWNGAPNGIWNTGPDELARMVRLYHDAGHHIHIHTNGDEASEVAIDALERALTASPRPDHRHTLQHCQMADEAQMRRMRALGVGVNLFSNHLFYWGEAHRALTMGPERARRMDAAGTARRLGVPLAIHSDAPVTPIDPLFTAWCAVNRRTHAGRVLGPEEAIGVEEALRAITLGAAHTLHLDGEIGSIEAGKRADFAVLEADPLEVAPEALKDVPVWGTVMGGRIFEGGAPLEPEQAGAAPGDG